MGRAALLHARFYAPSFFCQPLLPAYSFANSVQILATKDKTGQRKGACVVSFVPFAVNLSSFPAFFFPIFLPLVSVLSRSYRLRLEPRLPRRADELEAKDAGF